MNLFTHILKFFGLLLLMSVVSMYVPFGRVAASLVVFYGIWKLIE